MDNSEGNELESSEESSGNADIVDYVGDMNKSESLTTASSSTDSGEPYASNLETENPLLIPMGVVGGLVILIILMTLICFIYRKQRRQSARISKRRSERRSVVSDDIGTNQNLLNGPIGFSQAVYGIEDEVERTITISVRPSSSEPAIAETSLDSDISRMKPLNSNHLNNACKSKTGGSKTRLSDIKSTQSSDIPETWLEMGRTVDEIKPSFNAASSTAECHSSKEITLKQGKFDANRLNSEDDVLLGTSVSKDHCDSDMKENGKMINFPSPSPCRSEHNIDYINIPNGTGKCHVVERETEKCYGYVNVSDDTENYPTYNEQYENNNECQAPYDCKIVIEATQDDECVKCENEGEDINKNYVNVPKKLNKPPSYDEVTANDNHCKDFGDTKLTISEMSEYVNMPKEKSKFEAHSSMKNKKRCFRKDSLPKTGSPGKHAFISESDMYLPMDCGTEQENEYLPVDNPDTLICYERYTLSKNVPKMFYKESKSVDAICLDSYVNTRSTVIPVRSSSCDSVYSYADPNIMSSLYCTGDNLVKKSTQLKSRTANRSKTFSPADSKVRPNRTGSRQNRSEDDFTKQTDTSTQLKSRTANRSNTFSPADSKVRPTRTGSRQNRSEYDCTKQTDTSNFASNKRNFQQEQKLSTRQVSNCEETIICAPTDDYINADIHVPECSSRRNTKSRIPVSTRIKKSNCDSNANENSSSKTQKIIVDQLDHDYVNSPHRKRIEVSNVRKLKAPAVLPKPKASGNDTTALTLDNGTSKGKTVGLQNTSVSLSRVIPAINSKFQQSKASFEQYARD